MQIVLYGKIYIRYLERHCLELFEGRIVSVRYRIRCEEISLVTEKTFERQQICVL